MSPVRLLPALPSSRYWRWTLFTLVNAEEREIDSRHLEQVLERASGYEDRSPGDADGASAALPGLEPGWSARVLKKAVGNTANRLLLTSLLAGAHPSAQAADTSLLSTAASVVSADAASGGFPDWNLSAADRVFGAGGDTGPDLAPYVTAGAEPDWSGIRRDVTYLLGYQVVTVAFLYTLPESVTKWSDEDKEEYTLSRWWENVRNPDWDEDEWWINYLLHPYWGAAYYVRGQERGLDGVQSVFYSALLSGLYEFGVEALFERPSYQDLISTPIVGSMLGHYFMSVRREIRARADDPRPTDGLVLALTDPLGAMNDLVDDWLGREAQLGFSLSPPPMLPTTDGQLDGEAPPLRARALADRGTVWALQLRIPW